MQSDDASQILPRQITKAPPWHELVTADLFFSSLGAGTFIVAALCMFTRAGLFTPLVRVTLLVPFPIMMADLVCLVLDLGDPLRFHHMMRVVKPRSPMSVGVWAISLFTVIAFAALIVAIFAPSETAFIVLGAIGIGPALLVSGYKGVLFSVTAEPTWSTMRWLGATFSVSAISMGAALMLLLAYAMNAAPAAPILRAVVLWLLLATAILIAFEAFAEPRRRSVGVASDYRQSAVLVTYVGAGIVTPIVLVLLSGELSVLDLAAGLLVLFGAALARDYLVRIPRAQLSG